VLSTAPMSKVLVTGAGGFIGSHLCEQLLARGREVRALVRYNGRGSQGWLDTSPLRDRIEIVAGDIRDFDSVSRAATDCDEVFHLAALIGIPYSYESPLAYVRTNVEGTYNVLEAARRSGMRRVLITSTSEVYGTAIYTPIDEAHPLQPQSPYSASKIGADQLALSYHLSFGLPVVVARPFNTYGPRQSARAIIPSLATQLLSRRPYIEVGSLDPVRDLTFVEDTASAMITIASTDAFVGRVINVGTGEAISIREIYERLVAITGHQAELRQDPARIRPQASEVMKLISNNSVLRSTTSWKNEVNIDAGLARTVEWLRSNLAGYRPERYTV
jgi:NAD dependent epimerase/dehydratase